MAKGYSKFSFTTGAATASVSEMNNGLLGEMGYQQYLSVLEKGVGTRGLRTIHESPHESPHEVPTLSMGHKQGPHNKVDGFNGQ